MWLSTPSTRILFHISISNVIISFNMADPHVMTPLSSWKMTLAVGPRTRWPLTPGVRKRCRYGFVAIPRVKVRRNIFLFRPKEPHLGRNFGQQIRCSRTNAFQQSAKGTLYCDADRAYCCKVEVKPLTLHGIECVRWSEFIRWGKGASRCGSI
jgi:hypothetical protein